MIHIFTFFIILIEYHKDFEVLVYEYVAFFEISITIFLKKKGIYNGPVLRGKIVRILKF